MAEYEKLKTMLHETPFVTVNMLQGTAQFAEGRETFRSLLRDNPMECSRATVNALRALNGFAALKGVGKDDKTFTIDEVAKVAGMPKVTCHNYVQRTIFRPSVSGRTGRGGNGELLFSWHDCYVAGLVGAFRRLGLHPDLLQQVSDLFYQDEKKKRTGRKMTASSRS